MSTNSSISIKYKNGEYHTQYCHWDGYISHNGDILYKYYNTLDKVEELLSYGDISVLSKNIDSCEFYCRDKGKDLNIVISNVITEQAFKYVFKNDEWYVYDYYRWDDVIDEEIYYGEMKLFDALSFEIPEYKQKLRCLKLKRIIEN